MVEHRTFGRGGWGSKPPVVERQTFRSKGPGFKIISAVSKLGPLRLPHFACVFRKRQESCWSLLYGAYARGSNRRHTGKWKIPAVDSNSTEGKL